MRIVETEPCVSRRSPADQITRNSPGFPDYAFVEEPAAWSRSWVWLRLWARSGASRFRPGCASGWASRREMACMAGEEHRQVAGGPPRGSQRARLTDLEGPELTDLEFGELGLMRVRRRGADLHDDDSAGLRDLAAEQPSRAMSSGSGPSVRPSKPSIAVMASAEGSRLLDRIWHVGPCRPDQVREVRHSVPVLVLEGGIGARASRLRALAGRPLRQRPPQGAATQHSSSSVASAILRRARRPGGFPAASRAARRRWP